MSTARNRMPPWQIEDLCKTLLEEPMSATAVYLIRELASRIVQLEEEHAELRDRIADVFELVEAQDLLRDDPPEPDGPDPAA